MISNERQHFKARGLSPTIKVVAGVSCSFAVGYDRRRRGHPAGFVAEVHDVEGRQP
jgi:uncharacterized membrane protein YhiD involved in acid resistance